MSEFIPKFTRAAGWGVIENPLGEDADSVDEALKDQFWDMFDSLGCDAERIVEIYQHCIEGSEEFLVSYNTFSYYRIIYVPDFSSLVGLMKELEPMVKMRNSSALLEIVAELNDLLVDYGGPLEDMLMTKHRRLRESKVKHGR